MREKEEIKILTWADIKELANSLNEHQLKQPVNYWTDFDGGTISDANILDEDYKSDGESYKPVSELEDDEIDPDAAIFLEGTVMLWVL